jgi:hypothetical protein
MKNDSTLIKIGIDLNKIPKDMIKKGEKGTWLNLDVWVNKEANEWGNNVSCSVSRKSKTSDKWETTYLGNGNVQITDGEVKAFPRGDRQKKKEVEDDFPFF